MIEPRTVPHDGTASRRAPFGLAAELLGLAMVLLFTVVVIFTRLKDFAWSTFALIFKWAVLAYEIEVGMIEFSVIGDHTSGTSLMIESRMIVVFGVSVPTTIVFIAARFAKS